MVRDFLYITFLKVRILPYLKMPYFIFDCFIEDCLLFGNGIIEKSVAKEEVNLKGITLITNTFQHVSTAFSSCNY